MTKKRKYSLAIKGVPERPANPLPNYYSEAYVGMEQDMAEDILATMYWKRRDQLEADGKWETEEKSASHALMIANVIMDAAPQADEMANAMERAKFRILMSIEKHKLYHLAKNEYDTFEEYLTDRLTMSSNKSETSQLVFLINQFIPIVSKLGDNFDVNELLKMREAWSKAKETVPYLRQQINLFLNATKPLDAEIETTEKYLDKLEFRATVIEKEDKEYEEIKETIKVQTKKVKTLQKKKEQVVEEASAELQEAVVKVLNVVADPEVSPDGPAGISKILQTGKSREHLMINGDMYLLPTSTVFYLEAPQGYARAVESSLRQFVTFTIRETGELFRHWQEKRGGKSMNLNVVKGAVADADKVTEETEIVDIIASGYEWICTRCKSINHEIEYRVAVSCGKCGETFGTNPPEHAMD